MYFPFFFGRQSEFLALRAMLKDHRSLEALVPIIEPVRRDIADISRCIKAFEKADRPMAVILNPSRHELKAASDANAWRKEMLELLEENPATLPTYRCGSGSSIANLKSFLKRFAGRDVVVCYAIPTLSDSELTELAGSAHIRYHIVLNGEMTGAQVKLLPKKKRVDVRDYFNKKERNADYDGAERFTDAHKKFSPDWVGFGDYACLGAAFNPGGWQPAAVAAHAIYRHGSGDIWIEHFVSDDTDQKVGTAEEKFLQAAAKLVAAAKARPKEFGTNFALDAFESHVANHHYPGLGENKVLQIDHHICVMLDVLSGAL